MIHMNSRLRTALTFWLALNSMSLFAQTDWTLQKCIQHAQDNNLNIMQGKLAVQGSKNTLNQSKQAVLPNASAFVGNGLNFGRNINPKDNTYTIQEVKSSQFSLSSSVTVFNAFAILNNIKMSQVNLEASQKDLEVISNNVSLQVATQFLQILFNREAIKVVSSRIASTQKQLERARVLFEAGNTNQGSVLELEARLSSEKLELVNAENAYQIALLALANLLQVPFDEGFDIVSPEVKIPGELIEERTGNIYAKASKIMPEIEAAQLKYEAALLQKRIAKASYYPNLTFNANVNTLYSDNFVIPTGSGTFRKISFSDQIDGNLGQSLSLNLNIPIYNRGRVLTSVRQADIAGSQQKLNIRQAENTLYTSVANAVANYKAALAKYVALNEAVTAQKKNYDYNVTRFETGALSSADMIISRSGYEVAEANLIQGKYDLVFRKVLLDFYRGKPLSLD